MPTTPSPGPISLKAFLESVPPAIWRELDSPFERQSNIHRADYLQATMPSLMLECGQVGCEREMIFDPNDKQIVIGSGDLSKPRSSEHFVTYVCRHCRRGSRVYALRLLGQQGKNGSALKIGEWPPFGPRIPRTLMDVFDADKELLLNGRRCENQGLGIGALAYYRRVIENEKNTLFDAIIAAAKKVSGTEGLIGELEEAKSKQSFAESTESIRAIWPEQLRLNGESPLNLLHSALSAGLHAHDDATAQEIATNMRTVLSALAKQLVELRKDNEELTRAIAALSKLRQPKKEQ